MKSLLYRLGTKPRNFDDFNHYCDNKAVPESVHLVVIKKPIHILTFMGPLTVYPNCLKYEFNNFSFNKYYKSMSQLERDINLIKIKGIKINNNDLEAVLNEVIS